MAKNKKKIKYKILPVTVASMILFAVATSVVGYFMIGYYERGILDVCATQQDAYVQLVLDQINIKENREDEEIITEILDSMDASSNKYWTFSREEAMLFVKDVLETNKYKGFTTSSYFSTGSAKAFYDGMSLNKVKHSTIQIDEKEYIASGVIFDYDGEEYRLCLLTNRDALLDNNNYLQAKIIIATIFVIILFLLIIIPTMYAYRIRLLLEKKDDQANIILELNNKLMEINNRIANQDLHDTKTNLWKEDAFAGFVDKLKERYVLPVTIVNIHCENRKVRNEFLNKIHIMLNKQVLRFEQGEDNLLLIFVQLDAQTVRDEVTPLTDETVYIEHSFMISAKEDYDITRIYNELGIEGK